MSIPRSGLPSTRCSAVVHRLGDGIWLGGDGFPARGSHIDAMLTVPKILVLHLERATIASICGQRAPLEGPEDFVLGAARAELPQPDCG